MKKHAVSISVAIVALLLVWAVVFLASSDEQPAAEQAPIDAPAPTPQETAPEPRGETEPAVPGAEPTPAPEAPPARQRIPGDQAAAEVKDQPGKLGPVEELKAAYQSDPRDPEAGATEERIRGHLKQDEIPEGLVRRVSCVKSACKIEVNWTSDHRQGYMIAMMTLISHVSEQVAAEPVGDIDGQTVHPVDVYVSRVVPPFTPPGSN